ncbi:type II CAAX endopeptidase family protein [Symbiobacterium thermophilum]|uniref:CAAX prenyl protease 2/Lysostaphin resistance protein A-like domain-containing protein n=1 Tax=Symbiobacterium thermophilum (strain DSM 24528 / JCM 14929 / IAM 14863 / T) TaxID=292459 RepID=Q67T28_SYMTH|nr:type II CAAX endopeptidase family protein [Symbiobacterium thermophilum]BAD39165.1 conserved hypothetical protein [Symbiobacterium thermophilum IAM 14863]
MTTRQQVALLRVLAFYLTALVLLLVAGSALQYTLGLAGVVVSQLLIFVALPLVFTLAVEKRPVRPFLRLRMLSLRGVGRAVVLGLIGWLAAQLMGAVLVLLVQQMGGQMVQTYQILLDAGSTLALLVGALVPAFCEELSFRGYVLGALRPLGPGAAVVLTGLLFGALHLSLVRLIPLTLLGMLWALAVQRSGSILPGMIMHLINNGTALLLTFFVQDRATPAELQGLEMLPDTAVWGSMMMLTLAAAGLSALAYSLAAGFSPRHLARPVEAEVEWDWQAEGRTEPVPAPEALAAADGDVELQRLAAELAVLRRRRRRMLSAASLLTGGLTLSIYLWAVLQELATVFG